jgi:hypothetical protein
MAPPMFLRARTRRRIVEVIGWGGAIGILAAYALLSFGVMRAGGLPYQLLNITCGVAVALASYHQRAYQSVVLNVAWSAIALVALVRAVW